jgi:nicotinic acid mononucleotide adenylyltransferase
MSWTRRNACASVRAVHVLFEAVTALDISATIIRALLRAGRSPKFLLPDPVLDYILENDLYRNDREEPPLIETEESRHAK